MDQLNGEHIAGFFGRESKNAHDTPHLSVNDAVISVVQIYPWHLRRRRVCGDNHRIGGDAEEFAMRAIGGVKQGEKCLKMSRFVSRVRRESRGHAGTLSIPIAMRCV